MLYGSTSGQTYLVANRLGLGARPGEVQACASDPKGAAMAQIGARLVDAPGWDRFDGVAAREATRARALINTLPQEDRAEARTQAQETGRRIYGQGILALFSAHVASPTPFAERWSQFWSNHLCISATAGPPIRPQLPLYEHEVIRPLCFGRFADLVYASATSTGMLMYLDQARSVGPNSRLGKRRGSAGLNENYARELMELHMLGVDGGYDLNDIQNLAKVLTGWTVAAGRIYERVRRDGGVEAGSAVFVQALHEPGSKTVLGQSYGEGKDATRQVINDLCARPQTATHLARKLLAHFVGAGATDQDVRQLAHAYLESQGDLSHLARTLLSLDSLWQAQTPLIRTPHDYLIACLRAVGGRRIDRQGAGQARGFLQDQKQLPWTPQSPQGWPTDLNAWADPNAIKARTEFAQQFAANMVDGGVAPDATDLGAQVLDLAAAPALASALGNASSRANALTLLFASPQFMWR